MLNANQIATLELLVQYRQRFALWRDPNSRKLSFIWQHKSLDSFENLCEIENHKGFVFAPFNCSNKTPIFLFNNPISSVPETIDFSLLKKSEDELCEKVSVDIFDDEFQLYSKQFELFKYQLLSHRLKKIVLSFQRQKEISSDFSIIKYFLSLLNEYPSAFCSLVVSPETGIWCGASPELLASVENGRLKTMSLAGTVSKAEGNELLDIANWTPKNREEQQIVTDYIVSTLQQCRHTQITVGKPEVVEAGSILHLRSMISATLDKSISLMTTINALHPTPAVCGIPKKKAYDFILNNELNSRSYYSGFLGYYSCDSAQFFVNLRCLHIFGGCLRLFAGGGLLSDSNCQEEYAEINNKMQILNRFIYYEK